MNRLGLYFLKLAGSINFLEEIHESNIVDVQIKSACAVAH
jgi:hypothetical protein